MSNKTIRINPELFNISGNKTKKKDKKEINIKSLITPNNLKNNFLKKVKKHKNEITSTKPLAKESTNKTYTDEFYEAIDYINDLKHKQKQNTKTLKSHNHITSSPQISLELPPELQTNTIIPQQNYQSYKIVDNIPFGCLKGGKKKTYREWKELSKPDIVRPPTPPKKNNTVINQEITKNTNISREERLAHIKNKLKKYESTTNEQAFDNFKMLEKEITAPLALPPLEPEPETEIKTNFDMNELLNICEKKADNTPKSFVKKTIKRKFTLGKSDKSRNVSVLIKNNQTRKNIIETQKELKKTNITDIKNYLRQRGIIKVGSTCPNDILRKAFEDAILTGDVTNTNKDVYIHNYLSSHNNNM